MLFSKGKVSCPYYKSIRHRLMLIYALFLMISPPPKKLSVRFKKFTIVNKSVIDAGPVTRLIPRQPTIETLAFDTFVTSGNAFSRQLDSTIHRK